MEDVLITDVLDNEETSISRIEVLRSITFIDFDFTPLCEVEFNTGFKPLN